MSKGRALPVAIRWAMRVVSTRVLPVPAPARTRTGPSVASTAARCSGLRPDKIGRLRRDGRARAGARAIGDPGVWLRSSGRSWSWVRLIHLADHGSKRERRRGCGRAAPERRPPRRSGVGQTSFDPHMVIESAERRCHRCVLPSSFSPSFDLGLAGPRADAPAAHQPVGAAGQRASTARSNRSSSHAAAAADTRSTTISSGSAWTASRISRPVTDAARTRPAAVLPASGRSALLVTRARRSRSARAGQSRSAPGCPITRAQRRRGFIEPRMRRPS